MSKKTVVVTPLTKFWAKKDNLVIEDVVTKSEVCEEHFSKIKVSLSLDEKLDAVNRLHEIYDRAKKIIPKWANQFTSKSHGDKYWEVILGKIIMGQSSHIYERVLKLSKIKNLSGNAIIKAPTKESYDTPNKSLYYKDLKPEYIEVQYYAQAAEIVGFIIERISTKYTVEQNVEHEDSKNDHRSFKNNVKRKIKAYLQNKSKYILKNTQLSTYAKIKLYILGAGNVSSFTEKKLKINQKQPEVNRKKRENISSFYTGDKILDGVLKALSVNIPIIYLESHDLVRSEILKKYNLKDNPDKILCGRSSNIPFLFWKAEAVERGSKLYSIQHGSTYGEVNSSAEYNERSVGDKFVTWGWKKDDNKDIPMPCPKLTCKSNKISNSGKRQILWISKSIDNYTKENLNLSLYKQLLSESPTVFAERQENLCGKLSFHVQDKIKIRYKSNKKVESLTRERNNKLKKLDGSHFNLRSLSLADPTEPLVQQAASSRVILIDHFPSTSFLELIGSDVPVIMFANLDYRILSDMAEPLYKSLEKNKVLHRTQKFAAKSISLAYSQPNEWYNNEERVRAINEFCNNMASNQKGSLFKWLKLINS